MALPPTLPPISSPKPAWVKECQYIEGEVLTSEAMCRKVVKSGSAYCPARHDLCFMSYKLRSLGRMPE